MEINKILINILILFKAIRAIIENKSSRKLQKIMKLYTGLIVYILIDIKVPIDSKSPAARIYSLAPDVSFQRER